MREGSRTHGEDVKNSEQEDPEQAQSTAKRTAGEAGWHVSRYNLGARIPDSKKTAIANLYKGTCAEYNPIEL